MCSDVTAWTSNLDLITARAEIYVHPAQLPQVRPGTIADDLSRRDFSINAIAIRLDGEHFGRVLDPMSGIHGSGGEAASGTARALIRSMTRRGCTAPSAMSADLAFA